MPASQWKVNELEYLEGPAASVLVFHDFYPEGRQSGVELILHDERVAANGDLRLGVWAFPTVGAREVDAARGVVKVAASYPAQGVEYAVRVEAEGPSVRLHLDLARPLPPEAKGGSFELDLFGPTYWGKTYHLGEASGVFPRQENSLFEVTPEKVARAVPLATGSTLVVAPEDPWHTVTVARVGGELQLHEGSWFKLRAPVAAGATRNAVELVITPNQIPGWRREPRVGVCQVGYHPDQVKRAVVELDARAEALGEATLLRVEPAGEREVYSAPLAPWGRWLRYRYAIFDFSQVREAGTYRVRYAGQPTPPFRIDRGIYQRGVWEPTLETYLPVQMCHTLVRDEGVIWHGACHLDDALQAPAPFEHIDDYRQGPSTDTPYSAYQHIPGLDRGGWHDAGDDDLGAGGQAETTYLLALAREEFGVDTDRTTVRKGDRVVLLHQPDGVPDIVQQVAHGAENLLSGYRAAGHSFTGIIHSTWTQRVSGDWASMTDGRVYDPSLKEGEVVGARAGRRDDRWAFTSRDTALEYLMVQALAASSRVLRGYDDALAQECLETALAAWRHEQTHEPVSFRSGLNPGHREVQEYLAAVELLITTGEEQYRQRLLALSPVLAKETAQVGWSASRVLPLVKDDAFAGALRGALERYAATLRDDLAKNPYGVPWEPYLWGVGWSNLHWAYRQYFLVQRYPELFGREHVLAAVNYMLGCHPGSDISFVCGVGAHSVDTEFSYLRAHWGYIPGAVVSGVALIRPDFPEYKDNYPYLWQQSEDVVAGAARYVFCVLAADRLLASPPTAGSARPE